MPHIAFEMSLAPARGSGLGRLRVQVLGWAPGC
jgi:hypothetical protein